MSKDFDRKLNKRNRLIAEVAILKDKTLTKRDINSLLKAQGFKQDIGTINSDCILLMDCGVISKKTVGITDVFFYALDEEFDADKYLGEFVSCTPRSIQVPKEDKPTFDPPRSPLINKLLGLRA